MMWYLLVSPAQGNAQGSAFSLSLPVSPPTYDPCMSPSFRELQADRSTRPRDSFLRRLKAVSFHKISPDSGVLNLLPLVPLPLLPPSFPASLSCKETALHPVVLLFSAPYPAFLVPLSSYHSYPLFCPHASSAGFPVSLPPRVRPLHEPLLQHCPHQRVIRH